MTLFNRGNVQRVNSYDFSPELVKETAFGHFVEESPVDEVFGLRLLGSRIGLCHVI
jgi:hypothetical protein